MRLKAPEGRRVLPVLPAIIQEYFPPSNDYERTRLSCLQALCRCYGEMRIWTDDSPLKLELACLQHLLLYVQLSDATPDDQYKVYPKASLDGSLLHRCESDLVVELCGRERNWAVCHHGWKDERTTASPLPDRAISHRLRIVNIMIYIANLDLTFGAEELRKP